MKDAPDTPAELRARALRLLARREHSRAELTRKLAPYAGAAAALDALLDALVAKKQLSDERFAEARTRQLERKYGAARIRQDLKAKGVEATLVDAVSAAGEAATRARHPGAQVSRPGRPRRRNARAACASCSRAASPMNPSARSCHRDADDDALIP